MRCPLDHVGRMLESQLPDASLMSEPSLGTADDRRAAPESLKRRTGSGQLTNERLENRIARHTAVIELCFRQHPARRSLELQWVTLQLRLQEENPEEVSVTRRARPRIRDTPHPHVTPGDDLPTSRNNERWIIQPRQHPTHWSTNVVGPPGRGGWWAQLHQVE